MVSVLSSHSERLAGALVAAGAAAAAAACVWGGLAIERMGEKGEREEGKDPGEGFGSALPMGTHTSLLLLLLLTCATTAPARLATSARSEAPRA